MTEEKSKINPSTALRARNQKSKTSNGSNIHSSKDSGRAASMAELMAKAGSALQILQKGQTIEGTIKKLTPQEILMDIGAKGDGLVIEFDKKNLENLLSLLKVGDVVSATVISPESEEGFPVLSLRKTLDDIIFKKLEGLARRDEAFEVDISEATRGGYFAATTEGVRGFLPASQILNSQENLSGKKIKVKILEVDRSKKRVVFSQKALSYVMNPKIIQEYMKKNDLVEAAITRITPYGLFVLIKIDGNDKNLPAGRQVEGFIHISEVSHDRVESLSEKFKMGDKIKAQVIEIDSSNRRVNLSIRKIQKDLFEDAKNKFKPEGKVEGIIREIRQRGIIVDLEGGITGFIPSDKIPSNTAYKPGEKIKAEVVEVSEKKRAVVLSPILKAVPIGYR